MSYFLKKIKSQKELDFFRQKSIEVNKNDEEINKLISSMISIIYKNNAIGVAGVMVGVHKRVVVIELQNNNRKNPLVFINPKIVDSSSELIDSEEASISIDNVKETIKRHKTITVEYFNEKFEKKQLEADGLLSICLQHEIDYLDGKLFIDYLEQEKKDNIINKIINKNNLQIKNIVEDTGILRTICEDVKNIDEIQNILDEMLAIMYKSNGIGLAANQIGINKNIVVIDLQENNKKNPMFLINPKITNTSKELVDSEEGCLSVPSEKATIKRYETITVEFTDRNSNKNKIDADGLLAICIQHETDHLKGKVFIDYLSKIKRDFIIKKIKKNIANNE